MEWLKIALYLFLNSSSLLVIPFLSGFQIDVNLLLE